MISKEELRVIAEEENNKKSRDRSVKWPDCYDVSRSIQERLVKDHDLDSDSVNIKEFAEGDFRHYFLLLEAEAFGDSCVVDASFRQFATDTDTKFNLANPEEIEDVSIVTPKHRYIFNE